MGAAAILTVLRDGETVKSHSLDGEVVLGRGEDCVIRLEDRAVSRQHAVFRPVAGGVSVERKSEFGALSVNGAECTKAVMKEGDVVSIGPYLVKMTLNKERSRSARVEAASAMREITPDGETLLAPAPQAEQGHHVLEELAEPIQAPHDAQTVSLQPEAMPSFRDIPADGPGESQDASESLKPKDDFSDINLSAVEASPLEPMAEAGGEGGGPIELAPIELEGAVDPISLSEGASPSLELGGDPHEPAVLTPVAPVLAGESSDTRIQPAGKLIAKLTLEAEAANVTELAIEKDRITIGRGAECDIVLATKKASRTHAEIVRNGAHFVLKDLESANGTFLNGKKVSGEQELSGDEVIRIGGTDIRFKVQNSDYLEQEKDFNLLPSIEDLQAQEAAGQGSSTSDFPQVIDVGSALDGGDSSPSMQLQSQSLSAPQQDDEAYPIPSGNTPAGGISGLSGATPGVMGIPGLGGPQKKGSLIEKYRALPPKRKAIWTVIVIALVYFLVFDEDEPQVQKVVQKRPGGVTAVSGVGKGSASFESLSVEKKRYIEAQHNLAFDHFKNKDYDKAIYEIRKIFEIVPDYKDSKDIERYALEGKRKLEAIEEEKRKREEEAKIKAQVAQLVDETKEQMEKKHYAQAKDLFYQILALDPENPNVSNWKKAIEDYEEELARANQQKLVQDEINKRGWELFKEGQALRHKGKHRSAISLFNQVRDIGSTDRKLLASAGAAMRSSLARLKALLAPVLAEAKQAEDASEFKRAYDLYEKASKLDPSQPAGYAGMKRVKGILHDRARIIYAEAVLAESYSDLDTARRKYKECLEQAPGDDIYHERSKRKLGNYFKREEASVP